MTAPGNSALLITLLAVFVACSGYAAGRLHQRYQMDRDREEAYRDGYDTATRSVFSLAARVIAPRRAVRAAVPAPVPAPVGEPLVPAPAPLPGGPGYAGLLRRSAVPGATAAVGAAAAEADDPESLGFPAPPPPSPRVVAEPAAVGGVVYRQFPDPHAGDGTPPGPAIDGSRLGPAIDGMPPGPAIDGSRLGPAIDGMPPGPAIEGSVPPAGGGLGLSAEGRHTVPDELVQATTYRLPPDRIFRAKVPDSALPEEPTTRLSVPKPRQS